MTAQPEYEGFMYAASKDALAVEALFGADPAAHCEAITFHCQQAAEKMLKNVFVQNDVVPPKSHDVGDMLAKSMAAGWIDAGDEELKAAVDLTLYAVMARYETSPDISTGEALKAIKDCNAIASMLDRNGCPFVAIRMGSSAFNVNDSANN